MTPTDSIAWKRIVNTPPRKIGPTTVERTMKYVETSGIDYMSLDAPLSKGNQSSIEQLEGTTHIDHIPEMKNAAKAAMTGFTQIMREVQKNAQELPARLLIDKVLQLIKYQDYLEENFSPPEVEAKVDTINELKNLASRPYKPSLNKQPTDFIEIHIHIHMHSYSSLINSNDFFYFFQRNR